MPLSDNEVRDRILDLYNAKGDSTIRRLLSTWWREFDALPIDQRDFKTRESLLLYLQSKARERINFSQGPDRYEAEKVFAHVTQQLKEVRETLAVIETAAATGFSAQIPKRAYADVE